MKTNENGRSMIEMLGVLAIIGVLSVGGIAGYSKAMMKFKTNKTIDQIAMTVTNIRTLYAQQPKYDISTEDAQAMGVVDDAMANGSNALKSAFGGSVEIGVGGLKAAGDEGAFIITVNGLPKEACVAIATNDWGSNYSSGLLGIATGASATTDVDGCFLGSTDNTHDTYACAGKGTMAALQVSKAAAGCASGTVAFKYY
jgi:type II secretory pathway pseudopilin PulG